MKRRFIDRFFTELDRELRRPAEIILTGAAAGSLMGNLRPSLDIDFEIRLKGSKRGPADWIEAIREVSKKTGIAVNFSEDIGHWSMIDFLDYRKKARPYKTIGRLEVRIMAPEYWTIGKMGRFNEMDIHDLVKVIRKRKLRDRILISLWGRALRRSVLSLASGEFRDHVIDFLKNFGPSVWGKGFDSEKAITLFKRKAEIK